MLSLATTASPPRDPPSSPTELTGGPEKKTGPALTREPGRKNFDMTNIEHQTASAHRGASLTRTTFKTGRLLDFCSERELVKQIGHAVDHWPLVILKELLDNAIDAAEEANTVPVIGMKVAPARSPSPTTAGHPGRDHHRYPGFLRPGFFPRGERQPDRGAQGNVLKTIVAMAFALDGTKGETAIESQGIAHRITFRVDQCGFADDEITRMTVFTSLNKLDVARGVRISRHAYQSRTGRQPPAIVEACFHQDGETLRTYTVDELRDVS
jgi:hypothetical protein